MSDKSYLFFQYWQLHPDAHEYHIEPEFRFLQNRRFRFDWAFPMQKVGVEVDGGVWLPHGGRHGTDKDREKLNLAAAHGWRVLRFSPSMLNNDPDGCMQLVMMALEVRPPELPCHEWAEKYYQPTTDEPRAIHCAKWMTTYTWPPDTEGE